MSTIISPLRRFGWLLRREIWENRISLVWAPIIVSAIAMAFTALASALAVWSAKKEYASIQLSDGSGSQPRINGLDLSQLASNITPENAEQLTMGLNLSLLISSFWPLLILAFVIFFYCTGALYDDRRDRSILFWKSLPISDTATVLSKAFTALITAPAIALIVSAINIILMLAILALTVMALGGSAWDLVVQPSNPLAIIANHFGWLPVYILWAIPTVGWLLLCSSFMPRVPFLAAAFIPVFIGALVSVLDLSSALGWSATIWADGVARTLFSTIPGINLPYLPSDELKPALSSWLSAPSPAVAYQNLTQIGLWAGVIAGATCIALSILIRRRSDDN